MILFFHVVHDDNKIKYNNLRVRSGGHVVKRKRRVELMVTKHVQ